MYCNQQRAQVVHILRWYKRKKARRTEQRSFGHFQRLCARNVEFPLQLLRGTHKAISLYIAASVRVLWMCFMRGVFTFSLEGDHPDVCFVRVENSGDLFCGSVEVQ